MDRFSALIQQLKRDTPDMDVREYEPMREHTSFRIGGPVRLMALPSGEEEACAAVRAARAVGLTPFFMGKGSNLLVSDRGAELFVIKAYAGLDGLEVKEEGRITAGSGVTLARLANFAWEHGLSGLEFAHGIPGSLGGGVVMNAGAYGGELCQVVRRTLYLTLEGERGVLEGEAQAFGYRHSAFSDGKRLILGAELELTPGVPADIRAVMDDLARQRREKQPLELPSAGSTFKRPEGYFAAALIDQCGLKGAQIGGAQVSEKHAGFLVNRGGATADDMCRLMDLVRETVLRQTGVALEPEVKLLGF